MGVALKATRPHYLGSAPGGEFVFGFAERSIEIIAEGAPEPARVNAACAKGHNCDRKPARIVAILGLVREYGSGEIFGATDQPATLAVAGAASAETLKPWTGVRVRGIARTRGPHDGTARGSGRTDRTGVGQEGNVPTRRGQPDPGHGDTHDGGSLSAPLDARHSPIIAIGPRMLHRQSYALPGQCVGQFDGG